MEKTQKANSKLMRKIRSAKWMIYEGPDTLVIPSPLKDQKDLIFRPDTPVNVAGYNNLVASFPSLVNLLEDKHLNILTSKEASKINEEQKDWFQKDEEKKIRKTRENQKVKRGHMEAGVDPRLIEQKANQTNNYALFKSKKSKEKVTSIDLENEEPGGGGMSMGEVLSLLDKYKEQEKNLPATVQNLNLYDSLKKILRPEESKGCDSLPEAEEVKDSPTASPEVRSSLEDLRSSGHKAVDSVIDLLGAWKKYRG